MPSENIRTAEVDLRLNAVGQPNKTEIFAGYIGEQDATKLKIIPPADMQALNAAYYMVAFGVITGDGVCTVVHSPPLDADFTVVLWGQLTQQRHLPCSLEAYGTDSNLIAKSAQVFLRFDKSVSGASGEIKENESPLLRDIVETVEFRQNFGETESGALTYKGEPFGGVNRYADLPDKPSVNGVTLEGEKALSDIGVDFMTVAEAIEILK